MKISLIVLALASLFSASAFARIVTTDGKFFIQASGDKTPLYMVNELIEKKAVSKVRLYEEGKIHLISFAKEGDREKLYSVDHKGLVYSIDPFASYTVQSVDKEGKVQFKEAPGRKYFVSSKGFILY